MALSGMGCAVLEARTASEVIELDPSQSIDLVVLDINMPGGTAAASLDALSARTPAPRVLLLSGEEDSALVHRVDRFARKPIELADFTGIVLSLLAPEPDGRPDRDR